MSNIVFGNFSNNILGYQTEKVVVTEEVIGLDVKKVFKTNYTVVGYLYISNNNVLVYDVINRVINNTTIINDDNVSVGAELIVCYSY